MKKNIKILLLVGLFAIGGILTATSQRESNDSVEYQVKGHKKNHPQGSWQPLTNQPDFVSVGNPGSTLFPPPYSGGVGPMWLLTDGSVLVQNIGPLAVPANDFPGGYATQEIWKLTPDTSGSYVKGTWSQLSSLPGSFLPNNAASAVLADGRLIYIGGEGTGTNSDFGLTNQGAIYDPVTNIWTPVVPPPFFNNMYPPRALWSTSPIADSQSVVLADGTFMLADKLSTQAALLDLATMTWTETGSGTKADWNDEEFYLLLPSGKVLTVDCYNSSFFRPDLYPIPASPADFTNSEIYDPETGTWSSAGSTIVPLTDIVYGEMGPAVLRPDCKAVVFSGNSTGQNVLYDANRNRWSVGPAFPYVSGEGQLSGADNPAALLPNGNVLVAVAPYILNPLGETFDLPPIHFFELTYDTLELIEQPTIPNAENIGVGYMLILPTGQIMFSSFTNDVEIYTPGNTGYNPAWAPVVKKAPKQVSSGQTYKISGVLFNGMSQGSAFGDDFQNATNYPLVRITNNNSGHVFYCRTHDHSSMAVASTKNVHTFFDVPAGIESGKSTLEVVANGIPSEPISITVN